MECPRLVKDRAILLDMGSSSGKSNTKPYMWRVFQITAYDEVTCAHTVRYASIHLSGADYVLEPNSQFDINSLHFDGREAKLVIAARNYCVLRRFKPPEQETRVAELDETCSILVSVLAYRLHFSSFHLIYILIIYFCLLCLVVFLRLTM
jgi:hypothetical protein